jgi:hypothetical protein
MIFFFFFLSLEKHPELGGQRRWTVDGGGAAGGKTQF